MQGPDRLKCIQWNVGAYRLGPKSKKFKTSETDDSFQRWVGTAYKAALSSTVLLSPIVSWMRGKKSLCNNPTVCLFIPCRRVGNVRRWKRGIGSDLPPYEPEGMEPYYTRTITPLFSFTTLLITATAFFEDVKVHYTYRPSSKSHVPIIAPKQ